MMEFMFPGGTLVCLMFFTHKTRLITAARQWYPICLTNHEFKEIG